ncbi:MAG: hypothetical protein JNJ83_24745 [Verrucomicrobiaceae bacterium]|nr:hypothetical protein [Verrucomicrobiaceae bacterium]
MKYSIVAACVAALLSGFVSAQTPNQEIRVKKAKVEVSTQMTPIIQAAGVTEKRWKPKTWLELDTEFDVDLARALGGDDASYGSLAIQYFIATSGRSKDGKVIVLSGTINYINIPAGENHALAFVTPAALKRALKKEDGGKGDVIAHAVVIGGGGAEPLAVINTQNGKWWEDTNKFEILDNTVIPKAKTPFTVLWGDYDLQSEAK